MKYLIIAIIIKIIFNDINITNNLTEKEFGDIMHQIKLRENTNNFLKSDSKSKDIKLLSHIVGRQKLTSFFGTIGIGTGIKGDKNKIQ